MAVAPELFHVDRLTCDIFSMLENKFLFGPSSLNGRVRILALDGGASTDGIFAAASLARLEKFLRVKSGNSDAAIADFFDVVAGSGSGGILASLLFLRGKDGKPMFTAHDALAFMVQNGKRFLNLEPRSSRGVLKRILRSTPFKDSCKKKARILENLFGELTLKDALKPLLIPCYDMSSRAPFLFSRADALEMDGYDFRMSDVCAATSADPSSCAGAVEMISVDGKTRIVGVDGGVAMNNPTAAAITHVLNNKMEFPLCKTMEDLLVVSLGNGDAESTRDLGGGSPLNASCFAKIAGDGASDMVDQAVGMAFGSSRNSNYVRIQQASQITGKKTITEKPIKYQNGVDSVAVAEAMLSQRNVESVLFQGKKLSKDTNLEKLEAFAGELVKEEERRKTCVVPFVVLKQSSSNSSTSPRSSSATTLSTSSSC